MAKERWPFPVFICILMLGLSACSQPAQTPDALTTTLPEVTRAEATPLGLTPDATALPYPTITHTPLPTHTHTPTVTSTPTLSPTPSPTRVPWSGQVINPQNAGGLAQLALWGRGLVQEMSSAQDGHILVARTPLGIFLYQAKTLETIRFIERGEIFLISPDENVLATGDPEGAALWDLASGALIHRLEAEVGPVKPGPFEWMMIEEMEIPPISALGFSPDSRQLAVGYRDGNIRLWDVEDGTMGRVLAHTVAPDPRFLAFSPQGDYLVSASGDLGIWRLGDGELLHRIPNVGFLSSQPFSPDGDRLVSSQWGGSLLIWKFPSGTLEHRYGTGLEWIQAEFSDDGEHLIINQGEQVRRAWDGKLVSPESGGLETPVADRLDPTQIAGGGGRDVGHFARPQGLLLQEDQAIMAWGGPPSAALWWWEVLSGNWLSLALGTSRMANTAVASDGGSLYYCAAQGFVHESIASQSQEVWDRCRLPGVVAISSDSRWLARSSGVIIDLFDPDEETVLGNLRGHTREIVGLRFSPDGEQLVSYTDASRGGVELIVWSLDPLSRLFTMNVPTYGVTSAVFSYDHQLLATGGGDDKVRLWRSEDGWLLKIIRLRSGVTALGFSPMGDLLAVGQSDGSLLVFSLPAGEELVRLTGHASRIVDLYFTSGGDNLVSVSTDGTVRLWGVP
jgi:WD40 repeat protein